MEYAIEEEVARQTIAAWIERCIFRNRQKHGQLKFKMHSNIERQISSALDESDELNKRNHSGKIMEIPLEASNERASMICAPQVKIPSVKLIPTTTTTTPATTITPDVASSLTTPNMIAKPSVTRTDDNNSANVFINQSDENNHNTSTTTTDDNKALADFDEYSYTCDNSDHTTPLLRPDDRGEKKLCNSIDHHHYQHPTQLSKKLISGKCNLDRLTTPTTNNSSNQSKLIGGTTFIDTCLINENATKSYRSKSDIESPLVLIEGKKTTKLIEPYEFTIIENPMGLEEADQPPQVQQQKQQQQQISRPPPQSTNSPSSSSSSRVKPTIVTSLKATALHSKPRQSLINKLSKLPDVVEDTDEPGDKHLMVYSCSGNMTSTPTSRSDKKLSCKVGGNSFKRRLDKNSREFENELWSNELTGGIVDIESEEKDGNKNNNKNCQVRQVDVVPSFKYLTSGLQEEEEEEEDAEAPEVGEEEEGREGESEAEEAEEAIDILPSTGKLSISPSTTTTTTLIRKPNYKYHNEIVDLSKHINDSCDEVKKWWLLVQCNTGTDIENISPMNSPKKKSLRSHTNPSKMMMMSSLASSKRRSGAAAVISRRPHQLHHHHQQQQQQQQQNQPRSNNLLSITIDEYTNDEVDRSSANITTTNTTGSIISSNVNKKENRLLQKDI
ncbi:unnamed protein product [Trichobilharzia regenti]|nr:unnamed protein product [Trichobilharzia regenti]